MTRARYRELLTDRVWWMASQENEPEAAVEALRAEMDRLGLWAPAEPVMGSLFNRVWMLLGPDNSVCPECLNLEVSLPESRQF